MEEGFSPDAARNLSKAEGKYGSSGLTSLNAGPAFQLETPFSKFPSKHNFGKGLTERELVTMSQAIVPKKLKSFDNFALTDIHVKSATLSRVDLRKSLFFESIQTVINKKMLEAVASLKRYSRKEVKKTVRPLELNYSDCSPIFRDRSDDNIIDSSHQEKDRNSQNLVLANLSPYKIEKKSGVLKPILEPNLEEKNKEAIIYELLSPVIKTPSRLGDQDQEKLCKVFTNDFTEDLSDNRYVRTKLYVPQLYEDWNKNGMNNTRKWIMNAHMLTNQFNSHSKKPSQNDLYLKTHYTKLDNDYSPIRETTKHLRMLSQDLQRSMDQKRSTNLYKNLPLSAFQTFLSGSKKESLSSDKNGRERRTVPGGRTSMFHPLVLTPKVNSTQESRNNSKPLLNIGSPTKYQNKLKQTLGGLEASDKKTSGKKILNTSKNSRKNSKDRSSVQNYLQNARLTTLLKTSNSSHKKKT